MSAIVPTPARRTQILAALDIDVWQVRRAAARPSESPGPSAASAALALLEEAQGRAASSSTGRPRVAQGELPAKNAGVSPGVADTGQDLPHSDVSLSLFCLSGPHGVLLANLTGLGPQGQRVLNDIFQATMRIVATERSNKRVKVQKLHFNWPPADGGAELRAAAPTGRALRGFLTRQLKDKSAPVILYAASELKELLTSAQLEVDAKRMLYIGEPEALLIDGEAKRALWQTLNTL